jgi:hypothetical protein
MVIGQAPPRSQTGHGQAAGASPKSAWPAYLSIIALLVLIVVALAGGIIWYNLRKSTELMLAAAERQMVETGEKISDRIELLYDPLYAIVGIASQGARDQGAAQGQWPPSDGDAAKGAALLPSDPIVVCRSRERRLFWGDPHRWGIPGAVS